MAVTGYSDSFGRTVANGLGAATSGQTYTLMGVATQFSVAPNTATIAPSSTGDKAGYIDLLTSDVDMSAQVALSAIPVTNLATVGFFAKLAAVTNYYNGTMMVATGGAISLRFSKVIAGSLTTISTTATGLTYVANTFYNLRYQIYWSAALQANVMSLKLWAVGATEPGGWMATTTDASLTQYTSGTQVGIMGRDESTVLGAVTTKHRSVLVRSYSLPVPATTDTMCADPAVAYPKQTAIQSIAAAADAAMATLDPLTSLAELFPRVRVSNAMATMLGSGAMAYTATEFNVGTDTNLGYDSKAVYLPVGIWLVTFEIQLSEAASDSIQLISFSGSVTGSFDVFMRSNAVQANDDNVGGTGHASTLVYSTDPTVSVRFGVSFSPTNGAVTYTIDYVALSAVKVSDYFA
jgi:hypothetical protein